MAEYPTTMKILVIEDESDIRNTLRDILEINGYEVVDASDGVEGLRKMAERPDFIFCDVMMPHLDGHGFLKAIRQVPEARDIPFVFLTAKAERADQRLGMSLGADDYLTKPFSEDEILEVISARTRRQKPLRERLDRLSQQRKREINAEWAHELLTPLNAVVGALDLLEKEVDSVSKEELRELVGIMREGVKRQEKLSRKLIDYFSLEQAIESSGLHGGVRCEADQVIVIAAKKAAEDAGRPGDLRAFAERGGLGLNEEQLTHAIVEVAENAFRFSDPGTPVSVSGTCVGVRYRIEIADQGPGMTPEQRSGVGAFAQFDRLRREQQGLGLGLAIARAAASLAGGKLLFEENHDSRGLRVVFDLPLLPAAD